MEGLIEEGEELMEEDAQEDVLDAGLISKAQHVEHYEIAGYGTVRSYAMMLGENDHARLLEQTLDEEKAADALLTELAEGSVNIDATIGDETSARGFSSDREVTRQTASDRSASRPTTTRTRQSEETDRPARDR